MKNKHNYFWLLLLVPVVFFAWYLLASGSNKPARFLPYYDAAKKDTGTRHTVPDFVFTDQFGKKFTHNDLRDKIYVTEFFFTTCQTICPIMNSNLQTIYSHFRDQPDVHFLSHTVDPETDSVAVLKRYADEHGVADERWHFVTGSKAELYNMARQGYFLDNSAPAAHPDDDFVHTQNFALVDKERKIRGYYDGTDSLEMDRLKKEIKLLLKEYEYRAKSNS